MSYCVSNMIGIRTGGVFSPMRNVDNVKKRIAEIILKMRKEKLDIDVGDETGNPSHCMSRELCAHKGSYIILAGVFNYWTFDKVSEFAKRLSEEFRTEVMLMSWDEVRNTVQCQIYLDRKPLFEIMENPIGQILRRVC